MPTSGPTEELSWNGNPESYRPANQALENEIIMPITSSVYWVFNIQRSGKTKHLLFRSPTTFLKPRSLRVSLFSFLNLRTSLLKTVDEVKCTYNRVTETSLKATGNIKPSNLPLSLNVSL